MKKYSFYKGFLKGLIAFILFAVPLLLDILPSEVLNLTLGGVLVIIVNFAKQKYL